MRWKLKLNGSQEVVQVQLLRQADGEFEFEVDGEPVILKDAKAFPYSIETDDQKISLEAWSETLWRASVGAQTFSLSPVRTDLQDSAAKNEIRTQMPGRVLKVLVTPGQKVQARQTLIIIEAMKMENEIRADADAEVERIDVQNGQSVESGALLLKLKTA